MLCLPSGCTPASGLAPGSFRAQVPPLDHSLCATEPHISCPQGSGPAFTACTRLFPGSVLLRADEATVVQPLGLMDDKGSRWSLGMVWELHMPACEALSGVGQRRSGKRMGWTVGWGARDRLSLSQQVLGGTSKLL